MSAIAIRDNAARATAKKATEIIEAQSAELTQLRAQVAELKRDLQAAEECAYQRGETIAQQDKRIEALEAALFEIVELGRDSHAAFDGERWREMWKVACTAIESWRNGAHAPAPEQGAQRCQCACGCEATATKEDEHGKRLCEPCFNDFNDHYGIYGIHGDEAA